MALSRNTILSLAKDRLYGTGLGEKPSLRQGSGSTSVSGSTVTFDVTDGTKVKPGHVLSSYGSSDTADAFGFYVLSVSTNSLTCVNGYEGAAIGDAVSVATSIFEHQAPVTEHRLQNAIDEIVDGYLYPEIFDVASDSFTPNLSTGQSNGDASDEEILRAWQKIGPTIYQIPMSVEPYMPAAEFASGKMLSYDVISSTTVYYSAIRRVTIAGSSGTALEGLIAKGAAALALEGAEASTQWESAKNDARERSMTMSQSLWQDFYQAKQQLREDISRDTVRNWKIERG